MGSPQHPRVLKASSLINDAYSEHLRETIQDLRRVRDELTAELRALRAQTWQRSLIAAELQAKAETERRNAEMYFEMLVEAEAKLYRSKA
jgi:hypothetical protein